MTKAVHGHRLFSILREKGSREMTEKEAWLELAAMFDSGRRLPVIYRHTNIWRVEGICDGICHLKDRGKISDTVAGLMEKYLYDSFDNGRIYFWGRNGARQPRATACCFLAAMCDTVTPKRRVKGS